MSNVEFRPVDRVLVVPLMLTAGLVVVMTACQGASSTPPSAGSVAAVPDLVQRGEYLVSVLGCNDCHTPFEMGPNGPEPDMTRMLSGHPEDLVMPPPPDLAMARGAGWERTPIRRLPVPGA